jgi:thiol-disulfide isomerase/thioredoxin
MRALLTAALLAAMPVRPIADAPHLVADVAQGKPAVIHFFASWCTACRDEFPRLRETLLGLRARGVSVALVAVDRPEDREKAEAMLREFGLDALPALLLDAPDPEPVAQAVGQPSWDGTLPSTFVFDAKGKLVHGFVGATRVAEVKAAIAKAQR